ACFKAAAKASPPLIICACSPAAAVCAVLEEAEGIRLGNTPRSSHKANAAREEAPAATVTPKAVRTAAFRFVEANTQFFISFIFFMDSHRLSVWYGFIIGGQD